MLLIVTNLRLDEFDNDFYVEKEVQEIEKKD